MQRDVALREEGILGNAPASRPDHLCAVSCQVKSAKSLNPVFKLAFDVIPLVKTIYSLLPFYCLFFFL